MCVCAFVCIYECVCVCVYVRRVHLFKHTHTNICQVSIGQYNTTQGYTTQHNMTQHNATNSTQPRHNNTMNKILMWHIHIYIFMHF